MSQPRLSGSMNRGWPPTPADRQADAVAEVCGYIAAGVLTVTQRQTLVAALQGGMAFPAPTLPAIPDGAVVAWSWPARGGDRS